MIFQSGKPHAVLKLLRPHQWAKNAFVLAPLLFAGAFLDLKAIVSAILALVIFSIAASTVYIINDLHDIEKDRAHPLKSRSRPLASGALQKKDALCILAVLYVLLALLGYQHLPVLAVTIVYMIVNIAYTFVLKHEPVIDIFTIAAGFVLRVYAGAVAITVPVSNWMFVTALCLALYLASIKRRQELVIHGKESRKVLRRYTVTLVDRYAEMSAVGALVFYSLYVMDSKPKLVLSIPIVLFGLFRYWFVVDCHNAGESPTDVLYSDKQLIFTVLLWAGVCAWALWPAAV
ncbi:decaprenyl-phosphate phosphoribosyltransferase [Silvimonas iriomotensis]|uniref:Decaprenyl-phosphate phosphoribosyltransferase n=1 Tax=Silvimonas iriomotensis TaxID=449662 RepID=A0ABQ2PE19_9NEIS|nr:decaprenyl-phosphate phosphoribosyltransferase [Silvimonas iriomotensis]GGP23642.1 decaprenyl-phosphate phosphoribosyltransferase [Silvimonas iriomotensis]